MSATPSTDTKADVDFMRSLLSDQFKRLTNLYYIKDKFGNKIKYTPWPEQLELFEGMHYLNIILKARQRGMTTFIQLFMLDTCLFNKNVNAGVIAHNLSDCQAFFDDKIKFAYDNLPEQIKKEIPAKQDNMRTLSFANGSSIRVGTSMRSGTLQYLHISEYGKICAQDPKKALEIRTGSLNTVAPGNLIFIESTAEGAYGDFFDKCTRAEMHQMSGDPLSNMDYKFHFFPWWRAPEYQTDAHVDLTREDIEYFDGLEKDHGIILTPEQKAWYVKKRAEQGEMEMFREYPSIPEEAFAVITEGAVFGKQMRQARKDKRILDIPYISTIPVNTFWDIGRDTTSVWFHQRVGPENRFIDYFEAPNMSLPGMARILLQDHEYDYHRYTYGTHYFPHDVGEIDYSRSDYKTRREVAESLGLRPAVMVERIKSIEEGIELARQALDSAFFDKTRCEKGIKGLENYRYERDDKLETYKPKPLHNWASHPADSFRQFAQGYKYSPYSSGEDIDNPLARAYRRKRHNQSADWRT